MKLGPVTSRGRTLAGPRRAPRRRHAGAPRQLARILAGPLLAAGLLAASAPASALGDPVAPWPMFGQDVQHAGLTSVDGPTAANLVWSLPLGSFTMVNNAPVIGPDGSIYVTTSQEFYAVNSNGTIRCSAPIFSSAAAPAISADGTTAYVPDSFGLHAISTTDCSVDWSFSARITYSSPIVGSDGTIYFGSSPVHGDGFLYALNPDGTVKWSWDSGSTCGIEASPAIAPDGDIVLNDGCLGLVALSGSGEQLWATTDDGNLLGLWDNPSVGADGTIYIGGADFELYAVSGSDGTVKWGVPVQGQLYDSFAAISGSEVFRGDDDGNMYAFSAGAQTWQTVAGTSTPSSPALDGSGVVYVSTSSDFRALSAADGTMLWSYPTGGSEASPAIGSDGTVYAVGTNSETNDAVLYAFGCGTGGDSCQHPTTTIDTAPSGYVHSTAATITFSSPEAGVTFECSLNGAALAPCTSPVSLQGLNQGPQTFGVHAANAGVNIDPVGAVARWNVDTIPPVATIMPPTSMIGAAHITFSKAVQHVTSANVVLRKRGKSSGIIKAKLTCLNATGQAVSCLTGPVSSVRLKPRHRLKLGRYALIVDPPGATTITDLGGLACTRAERDFQLR